MSRVVVTVVRDSLLSCGVPWGVSRGQEDAGVVTVVVVIVMRCIGGVPEDGLKHLVNDLVDGGSLEVQEEGGLLDEHLHVEVRADLRGEILQGEVLEKTS